MGAISVFRRKADDLQEVALTMGTMVSYTSLSGVRNATTYLLGPIYLGGALELCALPNDEIALLRLNLEDSDVRFDANIQLVETCALPCGTSRTGKPALNDAIAKAKLSNDLGSGPID